MDLLQYFDLNGAGGRPGAVPGVEIPLWGQLLLYGVVVVSVILSNSIANARRGEPITLNLSWTWVAVATLIALMVFPAVWDSLSAKEAPILIQMGIAAQGGAFWAIVLTAAEKSQKGRSDSAKVA